MKGEPYQKLQYVCRNCNTTFEIFVQAKSSAVLNNGKERFCPICGEKMPDALSSAIKAALDYIEARSAMSEIEKDHSLRFIKD